MKISVLKSITEIHSKLVGNKSIVPIQEYALVKDGYIYITNFINEYKTIFKTDLSKPFLLPINEIGRTISNHSDNENICFNLVGNMLKVTISDCNYSFTINESVKDYPETSIDNVLKSKDVNQLYCLNIPYLKTATNFISKDELRPALTKVHLMNNKIYSTDADVLYRKKLSFKTQDHAGSFHNCVFDPSIINLLKDKNYQVHILNEESLHKCVIEDGYNYFLSAIDKFIIDSPIPFDNVFPEQNSLILESKIDRKEFIKSINQAKSIIKDDFKRIGFNFNGKLSISSENLDDKTNFNTSLIYQVLYSKDKNVDFSIYYQYSRLIKASKNIKDLSLKFKFYGHNRAAIINDDILIMPTLKLE